MSTPLQQKRLPNHAYLNEKAVQRHIKLTLDGVYNLLPKELFWQARYKFLEERGYRLRPRYHPDWKPSWIGTNRNPIFCEDSVLLIEYQLMDATRLSNGELVAIKKYVNDGQEQEIAQFFASIEDPQNHCVPVYDVFADPHDPELGLMVMPFLRPCNDPDFGTVDDVVQFISETLEGLVFMHKHSVAHRDIAFANIMMDARALYPNGYHPVRMGYTPDTLYPVAALPRFGREVHYFYIDFGLSTRFPEGATSYVVGKVGRDSDVPELSDNVPYDAYKVDVFTLGHLYSKEFEQKYNDMEFLLPLIEPMIREDPGERPTAEAALEEWARIRKTNNESSFRWRLSPKGEPALERVVNDTVAVAWEGVYRLKRLVG